VQAASGARQRALTRNLVEVVQVLEVDAFRGACAHQFFSKAGAHIFSFILFLVAHRIDRQLNGGTAMKIDLQSRRFELTESLRHAVYREIARLAQALGAGITRVSVRLFDVNGLRRGPDKGCLVHARFTDGTSIVGSDVDADLYRSVQAAFEKVLRSRRMNRARRHTLRRHHPRAQLSRA
jgi:ribosome-associated translation inhibitor RaiA